MTELNVINLEIGIFLLCICLVVIATIIYILKRRKDDTPKDATILFGGRTILSAIPIRFRNLRFKDEVRIAIIIALIAVPIILVTFIIGLRNMR